MIGPRPVAGARPLLFDRLCDDDPSTPPEPHLFRTLDATGLRASVAAELERLLNTRVSVPAGELAGRERSAIDYGIPDLSHYWPCDGDSTTDLERQIERTIMAFEPRLLMPRARIVRPAEQRDAVVVEIAGRLAIGTVMEPVAFTLPVGGFAIDVDDLTAVGEDTDG
jgi:type VI secretion system lysozyme-like protein